MKPKKPTGKKFRVIFCEHGEDCLGGHRDEWRLLGDFDTREKAIAALKKDMQTYKNQWEDDIGFVDDGWRVTVSNDLLDASCEWDVVEAK